MMLYNTFFKISGNVITLKTYENTQGYGYIVEKKIGGYRNNLSEFELEKIKEENFVKSCRRAKTKIFDLVACNVDKHRDFNGNYQKVKFLTLTFKDNIQDLANANLEVTKFIKRLSYSLYNVNTNVIKYLTVPELQKRGAWHYHIILFNCKYVPFYQLKKIWGNGGVWIKALNNNLDGTTIAKYITKYISKGIVLEDGKNEITVNENKENEGDKRLSDYSNYKKFNLLNKKRYHCSKGLFKAYERKLKINTYEWSVFSQYIIENAKIDKEGTKEVYFKSVDNDYRGQINILIATVSETQIKALKSQIGLIYDQNRIDNKISYKPKWSVVSNVLFNKKWKENRYGHNNSKYDKSINYRITK